MKVVYLLPKMVDAGARNVIDDWSMVVDLTDNLDSIVSQYACKDIERMENSYGKYIRATYMVDIIQKRKRCDVDEAFRILKEDNNKQGEYYEKELNDIEDSLPNNDEKEFDKNDFHEILEFFPEKDYFDMFVHVLEKSNLGASQYKYIHEFVDAVCMKNSSSIDELASAIRERYGLIINGIGEERFADADVEMNAAFRVNMDAFKNKLRQIGFYTDMSDACILQKIRPRYKLED